MAQKIKIKMEPIPTTIDNVKSDQLDRIDLTAKMKTGKIKIKVNS